MSIHSINPLLPQIPNIKSVKEAPNAGPQGASPGTSFNEFFDKAIQEVNNLQTEADKQIEGLTLKQDGVTPHSAMIALEKADVAFQLMSSIRGKIVRAYEEVIRTQI